MQKSNKMALVLAWHFFKGNYALNFAAIAILILLDLLGMIPIIGLLFVLGYAILALSIQVYYGKQIPGLASVEEMEEVAAKTSINDLLFKHIDIAAGGFLGLFFLTILYFMLLGLSVSIGAHMNITQQQMSVSVMEAMMVSIPSLVILLVGFIFLYVFPLVLGNIILSQNFVEAFKSSFGFFSPSLWKKSFNGKYFILVFIWSLIVLIAGVLAGLMMTTLILIPVALVLIYMIALYNAGIYVFSVEIAKE